ncbi:hypothetical protein YPPY98_3806, partial [Yersinia pestis PY-98]
MTKCPRR